MAKASNTRGWYTFEDGYECWLNGASMKELKKLIAKHGELVGFERTS